MDIRMTDIGLWVFILVIVAGAIDLIFIYKRGVGGSISQFLIGTAFKAPFVSFTFGCVVSHLFFYMYPMSCSSNQWERLSYGAAGAGVALGITAIIKGFKK